LEVSQEHYADILVASATVLEQNAIPALWFCRHTGGSRYPDDFELHGFRVALAIASGPGMTINFDVN
jgi:hypothetical protein